jgi:hypothetical protein
LGVGYIIIIIDKVISRRFYLKNNSLFSLYCTKYEILTFQIIYLNNILIEKKSEEIKKYTDG